MIFGPYELLGVTPESPLEELRASFYRLSLLCHPDKGGDPRDMRAVLAAYRYVLDQVQHRTQSEFRLEAYDDGTPILPLSEVRCASLGLTPADIHASLARVLAAPAPAVPPVLRENLVALVTQELLREEVFPGPEGFPRDRLDAIVAGLLARTTDQQPSYAAIPGGYGDLMLPRAAESDAPETDPALTDFGPQEVVTYTEPVAMGLLAARRITPGSAGTEETTKTSLPDYSTATLLDYRRAFQEPAPPRPPRRPTTFEELEAERAEQDARLSRAGAREEVRVIYDLLADVDVPRG